VQSGERTEKATSRRRQKAGDEGQFAYSQELTGAITLAAAVAAIFYYLQMPTGFRMFFAGLLQNSAHPEEAIRSAGMYFLSTVAPIFGTIAAAAIAGNLIQGLPKFAPQAATFKWERLSPIQGLSRLKTQLSWIQWAKLTVMVAVIAWLVYTTMSAYWKQLASLSTQPIEASNGVLRSVTLRLIIYVTGTVGILAVADFFIQRWRFEQSIKQTKAEVKEDMKALEGNPTIKGKIKSIQREAGRRRMMSRVKDADVIVTNPTHYAVALEYKPDLMAAPRVVAKGRNWLAQRIKEVGGEHDIPTVENVALARALYRSVEIDQEIPMELYKAVAEVLAYVYRIRKRLPTTVVPDSTVTRPSSN
jgi:flagellar biosynthesis protein FlhB